MDPAQARLLGPLNPPRSASEIAPVLDALISAATRTSAIGARDGITTFSRFCRETLADPGDDGRFRLPEAVAAIRLHLTQGYVTALQTYAAGSGTTPRCWRLLFEHSGDSGVTPKHLVAVGADAQVTFELPQALVATWTAGTAVQSPDLRSDYDSLVEVVAAALDAQVGGDPNLDRLGQVVVRLGADLAWSEAERVWASAERDAAAAASWRTLDLRAEVTGRGILAVGTGRSRAAAGERPSPAGPRQDGPPRFRSRELFSSRIAVPLLERMRDETAADGPQPTHHVIIDLHLDHPGGQDAAERDVRAMVAQITGGRDDAAGPDEGIDEDRTARLSQYVVARLTTESVRRLATLDQERSDRGDGRAIFRIWPDFTATALINKSSATVKADAARASFAATGRDVVWAVVDSGIDESHPHFALHSTLKVTPPVDHVDYTGGKSPLTDAYGHGTHVAGIIAGELRSAANRPITAVRAELDGNGDVGYRTQPVDVMAGMAPACRLVSFKVLDDKGDGEVSAIMSALQDIQRINNHGRDIKIYGVNLSVGYPFDPKWFACGESPICVEVTRLAQSGVVVVVAAGNTGYGYHQDAGQGAISAGMDLTINDPGNAELAITVGSTHRDAPYRYGVSYFSSKGPTGDGRAKPDLVAPGERILSCAAGATRTTVSRKSGLAADTVDYVEDSGTSMSAAHVSGVLAAFLSIRHEYIGRPDLVKRIFTSTASDLGRLPQFQGHGLVDLMRAIQSV